MNTLFPLDEPKKARPITPINSLIGEFSRLHQEKHRAPYKVVWGRDVKLLKLLLDQTDTPTVKKLISLFFQRDDIRVPTIASLYGYRQVLLEEYKTLPRFDNDAIAREESDRIKAAWETLHGSKLH